MRDFDRVNAGFLNKRWAYFLVDSADCDQTSYGKVKLYQIVILSAVLAAGIFFSFDIERSFQKIDTTSEEAMKQSVAAIMQGLSEEEKQDFERGWINIIANGANPRLVSPSMDDTEAAWTVMAAAVQGKSAREIIAAGRDLRNENSD